MDTQVVSEAQGMLLFEPLKLREVVIPNRIAVAPMCQYQSVDGLANNWHVVHLGSRAIGGAGLVMTEATGVSPDGRITPDCLGLWSEAHRDALAPVAAFIAAHGAVSAVQLAHAGRRGARTRPWAGHGPLDADETWQVVAPSALAFDEGWQKPHEMGDAELELVVYNFTKAAQLAFEAGFKVVELHMAHGYLLHSFLSPLSNRRTDKLGGDLRKRAEFPLRVIHGVRSVWPAHLPLFVRLSVVDWIPGGLDVQQSVAISRLMKDAGVDLIDCSSGALVPGEKVPSGYPFQVPFAEQIRQEADVATGAVGFIMEPEQAERLLKEGRADLLLLGRAMLHDPYWARHAAAALKIQPNWPIPYARAVRHFHDPNWRANALGPGRAAG